MHAQVVVSTVSNAFQLAPLGALEAECVLHVHRALGVVRKLFLWVLVQTQVVWVNT